MRSAVAGVVVQTLGGVANEIFERCGERGPMRPAGFEILLGRLARGEPALSSELDELVDGYDTVVAAVRDLVDAGFGPDHEDGVGERIEELVAVVPASDRDRAAALVRVAARSLEAADLTGAHPRGASSRLAADALATHGSKVLPSRGLLIHGFADLTGVAADLLVAALRVIGGTVLLDRLPDPSRPDREDSGNAFLDRLELRLGGFDHELDPSGQKLPSTTFVEAPDLEAEARQVAERARSLLAAGARPEGIGVVARHLGALGPALRRQLDRLGVPFSGVDARVPGGRLRRRARRLADLLRRGADAELELWLETAVGLDEAELGLGLRVLSLGRLRDLAVVTEADARLAHGVPLPLPAGVASGDTEGAAHRLPSVRVLAAAASARSVIGVLGSWPENAPAGSHRDATKRLAGALGWRVEENWTTEILAEVDTLARELPPQLDLTCEEWVGALVRRLGELGEVAIGGSGGGVQVLTATEARGRTFDHLLLCGLVRGVFPRIAKDDPVLPDAVRARLAVDVLPEMPVKARSADEERYLFAQLVSAAPQLDLSWHLRADGRRMAPSPFVERFRSSLEGAGIERVQGVWSPTEGRRGPRPAYEHAVLAAADEGDGLALAIMEGRRAAGDREWTVAADRLASARRAVVSAAEPSGPATPGPWSGFVGGATAPGDRLWVTRLEGVATCPWRTFLERRLGIRPIPDPNFKLPNPDNRLLGEVVHQVLQRIVDGATGSRPASYREALDNEAVAVVWPSQTRLDRLIVDAAERVVFNEGLGGFGLVRLLAARARPVLAVAGEVEWNGASGRNGVLAAEVSGELTVGSGRTIAFRADRLDVGPTATDYKTGKPPSMAKMPSTRAKHLLAEVGRGRLLQAVAYALAAPAGAGTGRYVALRPEIGDLPDEVRVTEVAADDESIVAAFRTSVGTIEAALAAGVAFPRVEEPRGKEAAHCVWCAVAEACKRDDSSFRRRLVELMETNGEAVDSAIDAARDLWWLGREQEGGS